MVTEFINSPFYGNWFKKNYPEESLVICSPFFKNSALEKLINLYQLAEQDRKINMKILLRGRLDDFLQGSSDISALESLIQLKNVDLDNVNRLTNLHMKAYMVDNKSLLIGSGNFTSRGLFVTSNNCNVEGGIASNDEKLIEDFSAYYSEIEKSGESLNTFYDRITEDYGEYIAKHASQIGNEVTTLISKGESEAKYKFKVIKAGNKTPTQYAKDISIDLIPQFSNFEDGTYRTVELLVANGNKGVTFDELGIMLQGKRSDAANKKYGENHAKLAELLDLVTITFDRPRKIFLTKLGEISSKRSLVEKQNILKQQIFRMPIIKDIIINHSQKEFSIINYLLNLNLAETTAIRRSSNIKTLFEYLKEHNVDEVKSILQKM